MTTKEPTSNKVTIAEAATEEIKPIFSGFMALLGKIEDNILWIGLASIIFMIAAAALIIWRALPPREFTILVGREGGAYYNYALEYQKIAAENGFTLNIQTTAGSVEILEKLEAGEAGIGFVQGGIGVDGDPDILSTMAGVFYEPVWLFYRKDAVGIEGFSKLSELKGRRIAVGEKGSGTEKLALEILALNKIDTSNSNLINMSSGDSADGLTDGTLDFAFFVSSFNSELIQELLDDPSLALANVRRGSAYVSHIPYLTPVVMPAGSLDFSNEIPAQDITLLATVANLVVRKDFHPDLLRLMTIAAVRVHESGGFFEKRYEFPNLIHGDLPVDKKELAYLTRIKSGESQLDNYLPFWAAALIDRFLIFLLPIAILFVPLLGRTTLLYTLYNRRKVTRWYKEIRAIDMRIPKMTIEECDESLASLTMLDTQLQEQMRLSETYMPAFYELRWHMEVVLDRIVDRKNSLLAAEGLPPVVPPSLSPSGGSVETTSAEVVAAEVVAAESIPTEPPSAPKGRPNRKPRPVTGS